MMKGWKTWLSGLGVIATGIGLIVEQIVNETYNFAEGVVVVSGGLGIIGIGHKIEKN